MFWKDKVALSFRVLLLLAGSVACGQSLRDNYSNKKITLSFNNLSGEDALQRLAHKADIIFIYSTSILNLRKSVSLNVANQSLAKVLRTVGQQLNLTFKLEGDYIVVKKMAEPQYLLKTKPITLEEPDPSVKIKHDSLEKRNDIFSSASENHFIPFREFHYENSLGKFDSSLSLRSIKLLHFVSQPSIIESSLTKKSKKEIQWFAASGLFVNDFTLGGVEIQAGVYPLYAVVNASRINNDLYRFGYGVGTMVSLSNRVTLQLIYTAAQITKEKRGRDSILNQPIKLTSWHHQIKLSVQYSVSPKVKLRAGATFNMLNTRYKLGNLDIPVNFSRPTERPRDRYLSEVLKSSNTIITPYTLSNSYSDDNYLNTKTWIGFEIGIAYQINFSPRP